jgi:hypothetical protein
LKNLPNKLPMENLELQWQVFKMVIACVNHTVAEYW